MKTKNLTSKVVKVTADEGMWLTRYIDGVGDLMLYTSCKTVTCLKTIAAGYREITNEEDAAYKEARAALEASEGGELGGGE